MAKYVGYKRPKDTKKTIKHLLVYLGLHKWSFVLVAVLVFISAGANIAGTYLLKPVINKFIIPGDMTGLVHAVIAMGVMYLCGALSTFFYNRLIFFYISFRQVQFKACLISSGKGSLYDFCHTFCRL